MLLAFGTLRPAMIIVIIITAIELRIFDQYPAGLTIRNFYEPCSKCRSPTVI